MEDIIDAFAISFVESHFDEIDLKETEWNVKTKKEAIEAIKQDQYLSSWIISEVMHWGCSINYLADILVENDEGLFIIKINEKYFQFDRKQNKFKEAFPEKMVIEKLVFPVN